MKTKIQTCEIPGIPLFGFSFTDLGVVSSYEDDFGFLIDVIGIMTGISSEREYVRDGKLLKMVVIELTDESGKCECALFGEYVDELQRLIAKHSAGCPVIAIQFAKVKIFREKASIQNVNNATRILVNPKIEEADALKKGIAVAGIPASSSIPIIGPRVRTSLEDDFINLYPKKTIEELESMVDEGTFIVSAVLDDFAEGEDWWYPACKCHRSVTPDSGAYYCKGCVKHVYVTIPRFRVKAKVSDGETSAVFVLFDGDMQYLTQKQCSSLVTSAKGENGGTYPVEIDELKGMKLLFKVEKKFSPNGRFDGSYRVKRVCNEISIFETFAKQNSDTQLSPEVPKSVSPAADVEDSGIDLSEATDGLDFAEDVLVTPNCVVADNFNEKPLSVVDDKSMEDCPPIVVVADEDDTDVNVGMSVSKRKRYKRLSDRPLKRNLKDDFDASTAKSNVTLNSVKVEKD